MTAKPESSVFRKLSLTWTPAAVYPALHAGAEVTNFGTFYKSIKIVCVYQKLPPLLLTSKLASAFLIRSSCSSFLFLAPSNFAERSSKSAGFIR